MPASLSAVQALLPANAPAAPSAPGQASPDAPAPSWSVGDGSAPGAGASSDASGALPQTGAGTVGDMNGSTAGIRGVRIVPAHPATGAAASLAVQALAEAQVVMQDTDSEHQAEIGQAVTKVEQAQAGLAQAEANGDTQGMAMWEALLRQATSTLMTCLATASASLSSPVCDATVAAVARPWDSRSQPEGRGLACEADRMGREARLLLAGLRP